MPLLEYVDIEETDGRVRELLEEPYERYGKPSLFRQVVAHSPVVLEAWHDYYGRLMTEGALEKDLKELAHVTVSITNECAYCAASHTENLVETYGFPGERIEAIADADYDAFSPRQQAVIEFATRVATDPKRVSAEDVESLYDVGFEDAAVIELLAVVSLAITANTFTDSLNVFPSDRDETLPEYRP